MPSIPVLNSNQVRPLSGIPNVRRAELPNTGLQSLAQGLSDVGQVAANIQKDERLKADRAAFMEADRQLGETENKLLFDPAAGAFTKQGKDTFDLTPNVMQEYDKSASEIEGTLKTDRQKLVFREALNQRRDNVQRQLSRHEGSEREKFYTAERETYKNQAQDTAINYYKDPARIEQEIERQRAAIDQTPGASAEMKSAELGVRRSNTYAGVISRFLDNNELSGAEKYYDSIKGKVNGEQAANIERGIRITRQRLESERSANMALAKSELNDQVNNIKVSAAIGIPVSPGDMPSQTKFTSLYGERGKAMYGRVKQYADLSVNTAKLNLMSNAEIQQTVAGYKPTSVEGAADQMDVARVANSFAAQILQARKEDPGAYLIQTSPTVSKAWEALQGGGDAQQYFNSVESEKERLGIVSPDVLPKDATPGSPQWQQVALLATNKYRELPAQASKWADGAMRSNDPKVVAQAATLLDAVDNIAPGAYHGVNEDAKTKAALVASMMNSGADPERAVQSATDAMKVPSNVKAERGVQFRKEQKGNASALNSFVDKDFDPSIFTGQPATSAALSADFDRQVASYYQNTGDIDISRTLAWNDLKRVYGPTKVNGQNVMAAFPVEQFGVRPEEVRTEIANALKQSPQGDGSTADDITLVADSDTLRSVDAAMSGKKIQPSYRLVTKTGDLLRFPDGTPIRYSLPNDEELLKRYLEEQHKAKIEGAAQVNQAKADRALRLELQTLRSRGELR